MDVLSNLKNAGALSRHLSNLKLVSRLLGHELHAQAGAKTISLSREEVVEIQASIDLFIEEFTRRQGPENRVAGANGGDTRMVNARG